MEIKHLSKTAHALLNAYLLYGPPFTAQTIEVQMLMVGAGNRGVFLKARAELEGVGVDFKRNGRTGELRLSPDLLGMVSSSVVGWGRVDGLEGMRGKPLWGSNLSNLSNLERGLIGSESGVNGRGKDDVPESGTSDVPKSGTSELHEVPKSGTSEIYDVPESGTSGKPPLTVVPESGTSHEPDVPECGTSLTERIEVVDEMDNSGDPASTKSAFHKRRKEQIPLVQEAWVLFFPNEPPMNKAKAVKYLVGCGNDAQQVYDLFEETSRRSGINHPTGYMDKVMKGQARQAPKPVSTTSIVGKGAAAYYPGMDIPKPTDEWWEQTREAHKQAERTKRERKWEE